MKSLDFGRLALCSCVAVAVLSGCGASPPPIGPAGAMPQRRAIATHVKPGGSWMLPEAQGDDLLYASEESSVLVFSYPALKLVGTLTGFSNPDGICVDEASNVWIVDAWPAKLVKYAHGGKTPIKTIVWKGGGLPDSCAFDPKTRNLALMGYDFLAIFPNEKAPPTTYTLSDSVWGGLYDGTYDDAGNLFAVGAYAIQNKWRAELAELPSGGSNVEAVLFNEDIGAAAAQWNGRSLIVGGTAQRGQPIDLYQVSISGSQATITSTASLKRPNSRYAQSGQFALQGNRVIEGMNNRENLGLWRYPQGGAPQRTSDTARVALPAWRFRRPQATITVKIGCALGPAPGNPSGANTY